MNIYVPGKSKTSNPKILLLGEAPSYEEEQALEPFVGASGRFLNQVLREANIDRDACWTTNVCKYMVTPNPKIGRKIPFVVRAKQCGIDLDQQLNELRSEISQIRPNVIIAFGSTALWALTGRTEIQKFRGSILNGWGFKTIPTYHPAHILYQEGEVKGYWNKQLLVFDLKRAQQQSHFREISLPSRTLRIAKSSGELHDFIERNKNSTKLSIDIEASSCIPICIGLAFNKHEGLTVPLWNTNNISSIPNSELVSLWILLSSLLKNERFRKIGQNFNYDRDKLQRLGLTIDKLGDDCMLKAFCINPELPKNLAFNTSIYTEEPYYKDEGMYEGSVEDLMIGCARDACVTYEVSEKQDADLDQMGMRGYYENFLLPLYDLYRNIESVGFKVDESIRKQLLQKYIEWDEEIRYKLFTLTGEYLNTGSWQQVQKLLESWHLPVASTGEESLTKLLNGRAKNEIHRQTISLILEDRRVKKTTNQYLFGLPDFDGRMRTSYFLCLETGRSSTNQQEAPIRPTQKVKIDGAKKNQSLGMAFQTITKHGDIGPDVRSMFIPDDGEIFLQADSSQAEARVIFLLAEDYEALELIDKHDYHALTASWFFGGTESDYSKKTLGYESPIRFAGKTLRHAGHLGAGKGRAATELNTQARKYKIDFTITEKRAGEALEIFHKKQPRIREVFHNGIKQCLERNRRLSSPVPFGINAPIGGTRIFFERWSEDLFRQAFSYIPQRTVSENTKAAAMRINTRAPWVRIIVEAHDALLVSVPIARKQEAANILREEFTRPIDFSTCSLPRGELIIPCDVEEGMNYYELSKFKFLTNELVSK